MPRRSSIQEYTARIVLACREGAGQKLGVKVALSAFRNDCPELGIERVAHRSIQLTGKTSLPENLHQMPLQELSLEGTVSCQRQSPCCFSGRTHAVPRGKACLVQSARQHKRLRKEAKHASRRLRAMCSTQASSLTEGAETFCHAVVSLPSIDAGLKALTLWFGLVSTAHVQDGNVYSWPCMSRREL